MIISVQFKGRKSDTYGGMKFSYRCELPVKPGDLVRVPTKFGETTAKVAEIDIPESRVEDRILAVMKTVIGIEEVQESTQCLACEYCEELTPIGEGDHICGEDPTKMPVSDYQPTKDYYWCKGRHFKKS